MKRNSNVRRQIVIAATIMALLFMGIVSMGLRVGLAESQIRVSIDSPSNGSEISGAVPVVVGYDIAHGNAHMLILYVGGVEKNRVSVRQNSGTHSFFLDTTSYPNGPLAIKAEAYSADPNSGHGAEAHISVNVNNVPVDTTPPSVTIASPTQNQTTNIAQVTVNAALSDNIGVDVNTVVIKLDGSDITSQCAVTSTSVNCSLSSADGSHSVAVDCKDGAGNAAVQKSVSFKVDTHGPTLAVTSPANNSTVNTATINLSGTVSDATTGVSSVTVNGVAAVVTGGDFTYSGLALSEGSNNITVVATDNAGNTTQTSLSITSDTTIPSIVITSSPDPARPTNQSPVIIEASLSDNIAVDPSSVVVKLDGNNAASRCVVTSANLRCALTMPDGTHAVDIDAKDTAGNAAPHQSIQITTDTKAPDLKITSPADGAAVSVPSVDISGSISDSMSNVNSVTVNGAAATTYGNSFIYSNLSLNAGSNAITVATTDNAGNTAQTTLSITYALPVQPPPPVEPPVVTPPVVTPPPVVPPVTPPVIAPLTLTVASPTENLLTNKADITVTGMTVSDATLTVNGANVTIGADGAFSTTITLSEGENTISVISSRGVESKTVTRTITLDTKAPTVGDAFVDQNALLVDMEDNPGGVGIDMTKTHVQLDGSELAGKYDATVKAFRAVVSSLNSGNHVVAVTVMDLAGNVAERSLIVAIDGKKNGPRIKILSVPGKMGDFQITTPTATLQSASTSTTSAPTPTTLTPQTTTSSQTGGATSVPWNLQNLHSPAEAFQKLLQQKSATDLGKYWPVAAAIDIFGKPSNPFEFAASSVVEGDVIAAIETDAAVIDPQSIAVTVDDMEAPNTFDKKTGEITTHVKGLKQGRHKVEVTAADNQGLTGFVSTAFIVEPTTLSAPVNVSQEAADANLSDVHISNKTKPEWMSVTTGERWSLSSAGPSGSDLSCIAFAVRLFAQNSSGGSAMLGQPAAATYNSATGRYECSDVLPDVPDINGAPADSVIGFIYPTGGAPGDKPSEEMLSLRGKVAGVHLTNASRPGATNISIGEFFRIEINPTTPGDSQTGLFTAYVKPPIIPPQQDTFFGMTTPEWRTDSNGNLFVVSALSADTAFLITKLRVAAGNPDGSVNPVLSTEMLDIVSFPIRIQSIADVSVVNNEATANISAPVITGEANPSRDVRIYEFAPGGTAGAFAPVAPGISLFANYNPAGGYDISAPAMTFNGNNYDRQGNGAFLYNPCAGVSEQNMLNTPVTGFACLDGKKDIYAFLVTATDLTPNGPGGVVYPVGRITFLSAGNPSVPSSDQASSIIQFLDSAKNAGLMSGYAVDAYAPILLAQGSNNSYAAATPFPITAPALVCSEQSRPGTLQWSAAQSEYLASYTPLSYQGANYTDYVVWGFTPDGINPNIVSGPDSPVWWADGGEDISAAIMSFTDQNKLVRLTVYGTSALIDTLPVIARADHAFVKPGPGADYTWNPDALAAAGISPLAEKSCVDYGYHLIAETTASSSGVFSTQTVDLSPQGDKLIYAESFDNNGVSLGKSPFVTYHLLAGQSDTTPPQITFTSPADGTLTATTRPAVSAAVTDAGAGVDWNSLTCETSSRTPCSTTHTGENAVSVTFDANLPDGATTITLRAADLATPANTASAKLTINIDATPPAISVVAASPSPFSPSNTTSAGVKDTTTISANITEAHPDAWRTIIQNASGTVRTFSGAGTTVTATWDGKSDTGAAKSDGAYKIIVAAMDALQNYSEATASVMLDNTSPTVSTIKPQTGEVISAAPYTAHFVAADANGIEKVEIGLDGAPPVSAVLVGSDWQYTFNFAGLRNTSHTIEARAFDNAGNNAVTQLSHVFVSSRPEPPVRLAATEWPSGGLTLTWQPPTTNADGSPLSIAIAGYNIYLATETRRCDKIYAVAGSASPSCAPVSVNGMYNINAPALTYEGVEYADNPTGGKGPMWISPLSAGLGLTPMPSSAGLEVEKSVFGFLIELRKGANATFPLGLYRVTGYTQSSYSDVSAWIREKTAEGQFAADSRIVAHTPVCSYDLSANVFVSNKIPLGAVPHYDFKKINGSLVSELNYGVAQSYLQTPWTLFSVTAVNVFGDESEFSDIVNAGGGI